MAASSRWAVLALLVTAAAFVATKVLLAQNGMDISFHAFQDSRGVTVLSPDISVNKDVSDRTALRLKFGVDAISAASDSCARCHSDGATNGRVVGSLNVVRKYGDAKLTVGAEVSREQFYQATTGLVSLSRDLHKSNTTVAAGLSYSLNQPQLHPSEQVEQQRAADVFGSITQSWTKSTVTQFGYELNQVNGYQSNPFLRTSLNGALTVGRAPDARTRQALTARLRQALPGQTFLEADYRRYHDTWAIDSDAVSVGLSHHFGDRVVGGGSYRRYNQTGAFFYQPTYSGAPQYFTGDFRLFPFDSDTATARLEITPARGIFHMPPGTGLTLQYERYLATTGFQAAVFTGGFHIPLK